MNNLYPESKQFKTAKDWHVYHVFNDPEFINAYNSINEAYRLIHEEKDKTKQQFRQLKLEEEKLEKRYKLSHDDYLFYTHDLHSQGELAAFNGIHVSLDKSEKKIIFTISPETRKSDYIHAWKYVRSWQKANFKVDKTKRKPPKHHELIYAVFKSRLKNRTFKQIFTLYEYRKLPNYQGPYDKFNDEESLERYYNKYKPSLQDT